MADIWWQWLGLWFSAFSSATILPGTSDVVLVAMIHQHPQWWGWAWLIATIGNSMGGVASYYMGRLLPHKHRAPDKMITWIYKYGYWALLMSWVPFIGDGLAIAAGWLRLNVFLSALMLTIGKFARYGVLIFGTLQVIA